MIVIGKIGTYGVTGRKVEELREYLKKNVELRHVPDMDAYRQMCEDISSYVDHLNKKYKKSTPIHFSQCVSEILDGFFRFSRPGAYAACIYMSVYVVTPYKEGGESC